MQDKFIDNRYDHNATWTFLRHNRTILLIVLVLSAIASTVVAFLIKPTYLSTATIIPSNSNRMSKAILAERYSMDFMDYGSERDCEYALQILTSSSMEDSLMQHFNLPVHYSLVNDPHQITKTRKKLQHNVSVKRTNYMGVSIAVIDEDPQFASDMANFMATYYDTLCHRIHEARANNAYAIMHQLCEEVGADIAQLEDSLRKNPGHSGSLNTLIADKCQELAALQTRTSQTKVDLNQHIQYKFWVDEAQPADKKHAPKRSLVILGGVAGCMTVAVLILLLLGCGCRRETKSQQ